MSVWWRSHMTRQDADTMEWHQGWTSVCYNQSDSTSRLLVCVLCTQAEAMRTRRVNVRTLGSMEKHRPLFWMNICSTQYFSHSSAGWCCCLTGWEERVGGCFSQSNANCHSHQLTWASTPPLQKTLHLVLQMWWIFLKTWFEAAWYSTVMLV